MVISMIGYIKNYGISNVQYENILRDLKKEYNPKQIELISACLKNDKGSVEKIINEGEIDLSVCNDYVIRYTVTKGWIEISKLLLKHNVEP